MTLLAFDYSNPFEDNRSGAMIEGVVVAIVTSGLSDNKVKIQYPWRQKENGTNDEFSARLAINKSSLPQVNDQVLVAFEQGHFEQPIVIGVIWS